ncbi:MAG: aldo/keto reductase [Kiritimatiellae bacterium]|nr:aldo/keto reductase [Kiritimatiellia bacterium]
MTNISRRDFVSVTTGAIVAAGAVSAQEEPRKIGAFDQVEIGRTGIKTTRLCFGTGVKSFNRTSMQIKMGRDKFVKLLREAYELGVRCFDTADLYGSHQIVAEALSPFKRESYVLFSKIWWLPNGIPEPERSPATVLVPRFLEELKTDYIDVVQVHCVNKESWLTEQQSYRDDLAGLKKKGMIRAHGCSVHGFPALQACVGSEWVDAVHIRINPFGTSMNGSVVDNLALAKQMKAQGQGLIGMKILGEGAFANDKAKMDQSLKFALKEAEVDILNIGFMDLEQIKEIVERVANV